MTLTWIFRLLCCAVTLAALIVSLRCCFKKGYSFYYRLFPFYHLVRLSVEASLIVVLVTGTAPPGWDIFTRENSFAMAELLFLSFVVFRQLEHLTFIISYLFITVACALTICARYFPGTGSFGTSPADPLIITNIYLIGGCLIYFMDLFTTPRPTLSASPSFWIAVGVFFYTLILTPMLIPYLRKTPISPPAYLTISGAGCIILHLSLIKAYVCQSPKSLFLN